MGEIFDNFIFSLTFFWGTVYGGAVFFAVCIIFSLFTAVVINPIIMSKYDMDLWSNNRVDII